MSRSKLFLVAALLGGGACSADSQIDTVTVEAEVVTTGQINGGGLPAKTVVFTYDDGPDEHTLELARYLAENGIRATFFVNGRRFCKTFDANGTCVTPMDTRPCNNGQSQAAVASPKYYPESLLDELVALGHRLGNHTQDHCHLRGQTNVMDLGWELKATQDIIDRHICDDVFPFRAPFGEWDAATAGRVKMTMNLDKLVGPINWDVDGNDWDCWRMKTSPEACANKYLGILNGRGSKNGIFLMHDRPEFNVGYEGPLLMTKVLVPKLKADGFKFGTLDDVLKLAPKPACSRADAGAPDAAAPADAGVPEDAGGDGGSSGGGGSSGSGGGGSSMSAGGAGGEAAGGVPGAGGTKAGGSGGTKAGGSGGSSRGNGGKGGSDGEDDPPTEASARGDSGCTLTPAGLRSAYGSLVVALGAFLIARSRRRR